MCVDLAPCACGFARRLPQISATRSTWAKVLFSCVVAGPLACMPIWHCMHVVPWAPSPTVGPRGPTTSFGRPTTGIGAQPKDLGAQSWDLRGPTTRSGGCISHPQRAQIFFISNWAHPAHSRLASSFVLPKLAGCSATHAFCDHNGTCQLTHHSKSVSQMCVPFSLLPCVRVSQTIQALQNRPTEDRCPLTNHPPMRRLSASPLQLHWPWQSAKRPLATRSGTLSSPPHRGQTSQKWHHFIFP